MFSSLLKTSRFLQKKINMDKCMAGTDCNVFQYMVNHGNSWVSQESIMASNSLLLSSHLASQQTVREIIKIEIEEMDPTSDDDDGHYFSASTEDSKDGHTFDEEEYMACKSEIYNTQIPTTTLVENPCKRDKYDKSMKKYTKQHPTAHTGKKCFKCDECGKQFSQGW